MKKSGFDLRATYGMDDTIITEIKDRRIRSGETAIGKAVEQHMSVQIPDVLEEFQIIRPRCNCPRRLPCFVDRTASQVPTAPSARSWSGARNPANSPKHTVDLLQTFAAQSVLAIRNCTSV